MEFTKAYLENLIAAQVEESAQLEYKGARALGRSQDHKRELTKDISALANSGGGILIYGIREHSASDLKHLPECFDPVDQKAFSKEWLDQITSLIQPRIAGLKIAPVHVGPLPTDYVFVVDVPQSDTAHQALDLRYYRRRNFESTPMEDYEIRDVMNRRKHPKIVASIRIFPMVASGQNANIALRLENISRVIAHHVGVLIELPLCLSDGRLIHPHDATIDHRKDRAFWACSFRNKANSPLFPGSSTTLAKGFEFCHAIRPDPGPSVLEMRITVYADSMEKREFTKSMRDAEQGWV